MGETARLSSHCRTCMYMYVYYSLEPRPSPHSRNKRKAGSRLYTVGLVLIAKNGLFYSWKLVKSKYLFYTYIYACAYCLTHDCVCVYLHVHVHVHVIFVSFNYIHNY